jgi:hypothetical protein
MTTLVETVTIEEAIKRGKRRVSYPSLGILFTGLFAFLFLGGFHILSLWAVLTGSVLTALLSGLYWSFTVTKWRLWAFENVRNVHELKKRALQENIILPDDSFFAIEIRSAVEKKKWNELQHKFRQKDVFNDDLDIHNETFIYYSKKKLLGEMALPAICIFTGIYFVTQPGLFYWLGLSSLAAAIGWGYFIYRRFKNKAPQIILSNKGIQTATTGFYSWSEIKNEDILEEIGDGASYFLVYKHPKGNEKLSLDDLNIDWRSLSKLLITYRGRYIK